MRKRGANSPRRRFRSSLTAARGFLEQQREAIRAKWHRYQHLVQVQRGELAKGNIPRENYDKRLQDLLQGRPLGEWRRYFQLLLGELDSLERSLTAENATLLSKEFELRKHIVATRSRQHDMERYLAALEQRRKTEEITYTEFELLRNRFLEGRSAGEWRGYYAGLVQKAEERMFALRLNALASRYLAPEPQPAAEPEASRVQEMVRGRPVLSGRAIVAVLVVLLFLFAGILLRPSFTGFFTAEQRVAGSLSIGERFSEPTVYEWSISQPGALLAVRLSGEMDAGAFSVRLESGNFSALILDDRLVRAAQQRGLSGITAQVTAGNLTDESQTDGVPEPPVSQNVSEVEPNVIDTELNTAENLTEPPVEPIADSTPELNVSDNFTRADAVLPQNETPADAGTNATALNETLAEPPAENLTRGQPPEPPAADRTVLRFDDLCVESCSLPSLSGRNYTLVIEVAGGTLYLENLTYELSGENTAPVFSYNGTVYLFENESATLAYADLFTDAEGSSLSFVALSADLLLSETAENVAVQAPDGFSGETELVVIASDGEFSTRGAVPVQVFRRNSPPALLRNFSLIEIEQDLTSTLDLSGYFADAEGGLSFNASGMANITVEFIGERMVLSPDRSFTGERDFTVSASDGEFAAVSNLIPVSVVPASINMSNGTNVTNLPPVLLQPLPDIFIAVNGSASLDLSRHFADNETLTFAVSDMENITETLNGSLLTLVPDIGFVGERNFSVTASDSLLATESNVALLSVAENASGITNLPPVLLQLLPDITIQMGGNASVVLAAYFADPENATLLFEVSPMENVSATLLNGTLLLVPDANFTGNRTFSVNASDGNLSTQSNIAIFTVVRPNSPPVLIAPLPNITIIVNDSATLDLAPYFLDEDNDSLTFSADAAPNVSVQFNGSIAEIIPDVGFLGPRTLQLYANDSFNATPANLIEVNVSENRSIIVSEEDVAVDAVAGRPVRWERRIKLHNGENASVLLNLSTSIPPWARNISIREGRALVPPSSVLLRPANVTLEGLASPIFGKALESLVAGGEEIRPSFSTQLAPNESRDVAIEYYTPAANVSESAPAFGRHVIEISSTFNYSNLTAEMSITPAPPEAVRLLWNLSREEYLRYFGTAESATLNVSLGQAPGGNASLPNVSLPQPPLLPSAERFLVDITNDTRFNLSLVDADNDSFAERLRWLVPFAGFAQYEARLTILNPQSYPTVGGNWTVLFETSGSANLTIGAVNGTGFAEFPLHMWLGPNESDQTQGDLAFAQLRCNGTAFEDEMWILTNDSRAACANGTALFDNTSIQCFVSGLGHPLPAARQAQWTYLNYTELRNATLNLSMSAVFVENYTCDAQTSFHTVRVLTEGKHQQQFLYGADEDYANNLAFIFANFSRYTTSAWDHTTNDTGNITLNFSAPIEPYVSDANTILLMHLDNNVNDSSGKGNHGAIVGSPTYRRSMFGTSGIDFRVGSSIVTIPDSTSLNSPSATQELTIDFWILFNKVNYTVPGEANFIDVLGKRGSTTGSEDYSIQFHNSSRRFRFLFGNGTAQTAKAALTRDWGPGRWYHVAFTVDNKTDTWSWYYDGVEVATGTVNNPAILQDSTGRLNLSDVTAQQGINATLDEVRISNVSRTPEEIRAYYLSGSYTHNVSDTTTGSNTWKYLDWSDDTQWKSNASTALYLKFDEGSGTTALDSSSYDNDGTLVGATWTNISKQGYATQVDGTGANVTVPFSASLNLSKGNFTAMLWFRLHRLPSVGGAAMSLLQQDDSGGTGRTWLGVTTADQLQSVIGGASTSTSTAVQVDRWYQAAVTYGPKGNVTVYLNGVAEAASFRSLENSAGNYLIGIGKAGAFSNGTIDEVVIVNRSLSATEVLREYQRGRTDIFFQTRTSDDGTTFDAWTGQEPVPAFYQRVNSSRTGAMFLQTFDGDYIGHDREEPQTYTLLHAGSTSDHNGNNYDYREISRSQFILDNTANYRLVYSIYFPPWSQNFVAGVDVSDYDGTVLRGTGTVDQNGLSCSPGADLSDYANGTWYTRICNLTGLDIMLNSTATALEADSGGTYAYFADIHLINASGHEVATFFDVGRNLSSDANFTAWAEGGAGSVDYNLISIGPATLDVPYPDTTVRKAGRFDSGVYRDSENKTTPNWPNASRTGGEIQSVLRYAAGADSNKRAILVYRFDEPDGTRTVYAEDGRKGTFFQPNFTKNGRYGNAADFNVTRVINFGDIDALDTPGAFTVSLWFKRYESGLNITPNNVVDVLFAKASTSDTTNLELGMNGSRVNLYMATAQSTRLGIFEAGIQTNVAHHLVLTYDASEDNETKIYLDGALVVQNASWGGLLTSAGNSNVSIGAARPDRPIPWGGLYGYIDELAVYDYALPMDEVFSMYTGNFPSGHLTNVTQLPRSTGGLAMWIKPDWNYADTARHVLFAEEGNNHRIWLQKNGTALFLQVSNLTHHFQCGTAASNAAGYNWSAPHWFHVAATWNNSNPPTCSFFVNGRPYTDFDANVGSGTNLGMGTGGSYLYVGSTAGKEFQANATIDEVIIHNYQANESVLFPEGYIKPNQRIVQDSDRYVQWRALFRTGEQQQTPRLGNVTIEYNLAPTSNATYISPSTAYTNDTLICTVNGTADLDGDPVNNVTIWYARPLPVLVMPFEDEASYNYSGTVRDYMTYRNNATIDGFGIMNRSCLLGNCLRMNGSVDRINVTIPDSAVHDTALNSSFTFEYWVNSSAYDGVNSVVAMKGGAWELRWSPGGRQPHHVVYNNSQALNVTSPDALTDRKWHHVASRYNGTHFTLFVDAVQVNETFVGTLRMVNSANTLRIGRDNSGASHYNGTLDEFRIYNHSQSINQTALHNATLYNRLAPAETRKGNNVICQTTPFDGTQTGFTQSFTRIINNSYPKWDDPIADETLVEDDPDTVHDDSLITGPTGRCVDPDVDEGEDSFTFSVATEDTAQVDCTTQVDLELWNQPAADWSGTATCTIRCASSGPNADDTYSIVVSNVNDPPATITLNYPNDNDTAFTNRTPEYNWSRSADPDNVTLLYHLEVSTDRDFASGMVINDSGINNMTRYKQNATLGFTTYWWRARASDNATWSSWSVTYNFTVVSSIDISLTTSVVNFGFLPVGTRNDTSDNDPSPFVLENTGNTELNISVNASAELWLSSLAPLNSSYFQTKANLSEIGSINTAKSQMTYINLSSEFKYIAAWFNWTARNDTITIDINITAPSDESAGTRSTNITIRAEAAG